MDKNNQAEEMLRIFARYVAEEVVKLMPEKTILSTSNSTKRKRLQGIRGIADYLGCSSKTAQSLKDRGLFPVYWTGKNLYAYSDEVESGLKDGGKDHGK